MTPSSDDSARLKRQAAERAVDFIESGMVVGLGTGSTAIHAVHRLAQRLREGDLKDIIAIPTSRATEEAARAAAIPLMPDSMPHAVDLTIDGADEVDPQLDLIKGGGGALLREKIVAQAGPRLIIVVDESKRVPRLGTGWAVPIEVITFGWESQARFLTSLGGEPRLRPGRDGQPFITDSGHLILDTAFGPIADATTLADRLAGRAGIVEHGLFLGLATDLIVASRAGVRHLTRESASDADWPSAT